MAYCLARPGLHLFSNSPLALYATLIGIDIDSDLMMQTHVRRTVSRCFASLRQLRQVQHLVPPSTPQMLVVALVHSRLDYGNSVLVGLSAYLLRQLQSVLNAAARLVYHLRASDHITDALNMVLTQYQRVTDGRTDRRNCYS